MGTAVNGTDPIGQFGGREQAVRFHHLALAVEPLGLMTPILMHLLLSHTDK
jgi:hypothetical protein